MEAYALNQMDVDVLIAGGGVAGSAAAAALSPLGLNILIVEPKLSHGRRLAGELVHPPGIDALKQLGLLEDDTNIGAQIKGFSIFPYAPEQAGEAGQEAVVLPYNEVEGLTHGGMAIEHQALKEHLLEKVKDYPGVEVWMGSRVTAIAKGDDDEAYAAIVSTESGDFRIKARMIIGADGPMSQVR